MAVLILGPGGPSGAWCSAVPALMGSSGRASASCPETRHKGRTASLQAYVDTEFGISGAVALSPPSTCTQSFGDLGSQEASGGEVRGWSAAFLQGGLWDRCPHPGLMATQRGSHAAQLFTARPPPACSPAQPPPARFPCLPAQWIQG